MTRYCHIYTLLTSIGASYEITAVRRVDNEALWFNFAKSNEFLVSLYVLVVLYQKISIDNIFRTLTLQSDVEILIKKPLPSASLLVAVDATPPSRVGI